MRIVAVLNQKGGVGKTTTAVNLGAALARRGRRVLLVDLDPQGNLTDHLLAEAAPGTVRRSVYDVLVEGASAAESIVPTSTPGLFVLPSHEDLAGAELDLASVIGREVILRDALEALPPGAYDYVFFDCPPSLGLLSVNALAAAEEVFVVLQTEFFAMRGLGYLDRTIGFVRRRINPRLRIGGILPTMVDHVTRLSKEVLEEVQGHYGTKVFATRIRQSVRLAEAPGHQKHVFDYAPDSPGAEDYAALAAEVDAAAATTRAAPAAVAVAAARAEPEGPARPTPAVVKEDAEPKHETATGKVEPAKPPPPRAKPPVPPAPVVAPAAKRPAPAPPPAAVSPKVAPNALKRAEPPAPKTAAAPARKPAPALPAARPAHTHALPAGKPAQAPPRLPVAKTPAKPAAPTPRPEPKASPPAPTPRRPAVPAPVLRETPKPPAPPGPPPPSAPQARATVHRAANGTFVARRVGAGPIAGA